jgi:hypothetical protein
MAASARLLSVLGLLLVGCSGATNQDLFEPSGASDTASTLPGPGSSDSSEPPSRAQLPPASSPDAGTVPTPPAPTGKCTQEVAEPNNDVRKATQFTSGLCGKIDSNNDVDYGTFTVPPGTKRITWRHAEKGGGRVSYSFSIVGGIPLPQDGDELDVVPGATYTVQIRAAQGNGGDRPSYELTIELD